MIDGKYNATVKANGDLDKENYTNTTFISKFGSDKPYVQLDLGGIKEISAVKVLPFRGEWANDPDLYYRRDLVVYGSNDPDFADGGTQLGVTETSPDYSPRDTWWVFDIADKYNNFRYIRVQTSKDVIGITEIEVWGVDNEVKVASETFTNKRELTNVRTENIQTIEFTEAIDETTLNNIYAVRTGTSDRINLRTVVLDDENKVVGVDINNLGNLKEYRIYVDGVQTADGTAVGKFVTGEFTTGTIAADEWIANSTMKMKKSLNLSLNF